jgi:hypothetical protein
MLERLRHSLARLLSPPLRPGEQSRVILEARIAELELATANLERERDYWRGRVDQAVRRAEVAEDQVEDIRRLADRERGRGTNV